MCLHGNKEQIFAEIIANYDDNSNNGRTFCTGGACDEEGEAVISPKKREGKEAEGGERQGQVGRAQHEGQEALEVCPGDECKERSGDSEACPGEGGEDDLPNRNVDIPLRPHTVDIYKYQARH